MVAPALPVRRRGRRAVFHPLRIARIEPLCADAAAVTFDVPPELAEEFAFAPGQTLTLRRREAGGEERRSYSLCAPPGAAPRIGVRLVPGGLFSTWLVRRARVGDVVEVMGPVGGFTPDLGRPAHHVLVAAGSGVTPMVSIAPSVLAADPRSRVTLLYGNRGSDSVMFAEELADLKDRFPARVTLVHVLSREPREADVLSGRLDAARLARLLRALLDPRTPHEWWLCGPWGMVREARRVVGEFGAEPARVHQELFHAEGEEPAPPPRAAEPGGEGPSSRVTVLLDGRATTFDQPADGRVLEHAQRVRPDLPFACRGGVCGTCRARVTDGSARMRRNFALEPAEVEAGYVLTCQALPESDRLTVDFDS
ncbi:1,2-phenylacetyl-CoA epoxidase subunit PaaE [Streptomyces profundus]|uniref:1,2-phenylacetyl-CoA epoxidase subunit PaaE n=1 Tax=Streptomyces profundus TaxID=2867410 RepID=UPI001D164C87|nr:1,2-phenylacetyl-CoA epoxidase subunit PaaE [Streptomyces sp. MA3_2.13]UED88153.1 phenylacetate-CoA oxygenase/reductase subunit PaaK [Streptomyces sp. MA3_2.13]